MFFGDHGWLAWVGLALALGAIEVVSVAFVFLMLAGGALAGAAAAAVGFPLVVQVIAAVGVAGALLLGVRPIVKSRFMVPNRGDIGAVAQVGRHALVLQTVTEHDGRVKLGGETWSARTAPDAAACLPGQEVRVVSIEGATAIVSSVAEGRESE
ncbi:MAG TPA: NfeD family protein [Dermatophilaceae bacterium]|jgi:membrane protein implicated in regulation of membrane protease activity